MSDQPHDVTRPPHPPPDPLAAALAKLDPAPPAIDRDRLMFQAGAASRAPVIRLWQLTAGFLAAIGFAAGMFFRPPAVVERVVYVEKSAAPSPDRPPPAPEAREPAAPTPAPAPAQPESAPSAAPEPLAVLPRAAGPAGDAVRWLRLRNEVLTVGLGVLPDHGRHGAPSPSFRGFALPPGIIAAPKAPQKNDPPPERPDDRE
jgi:hypothetical protein